jgi:hypothetical protein
MPEPIVPYHHMESQFNTLDAVIAPEMNSLLLECLGLSPAREKVAAKTKHDSYAMQLMDVIYRSPDDVLTATNDMVNRRNASESESMYRVPQGVSDHDLLNLKAAGYVQGHGRGVAFTSKGQEALRDFWLIKDNALRMSRTKPEFVHPWRRTANFTEDSNRTASSDQPKKRFKRS